jgi:hypothetical protein
LSLAFGGTKPTQKNPLKVGCKHSATLDDIERYLDGDELKAKGK